MDQEQQITVEITPNETGNPPGKLADAAILFHTGPLAGMKLIGFSIWETRRNANPRSVTFPARQYTVNGERRSFALLRPSKDANSNEAVRKLVLDAFEDWERRATSTPQPAPTPATSNAQPTETVDAPLCDRAKPVIDF